MCLSALLHPLLTTSTLQAYEGETEVLSEQVDPQATGTPDSENWLPSSETDDTASDDQSEQVLQPETQESSTQTMIKAVKKHQKMKRMSFLSCRQNQKMMTLKR
ncbi:MAG: hypothetical protein ACLSIL_16285 [Enterococcus casseliflavus]